MTTKNRSKTETVVKSTLEELAEKADANTQARFHEQAANGVVNPIVLAKLVGVRPQMVYNYLSKGKFSEHEDVVGENSTQKKVIKLDEANTWAKSYLDRKVTRETKEAEKVAEELEGTTA